jgi:hypothetical protein
MKLSTWHGDLFLLRPGSGKLQLGMYVAALLLMSVSLAGCGEHAADCLWVRNVQAFIDINSNKQLDKGEPPLAGVTFHVDDTLNNFTDVGSGADPGTKAVSDPLGNAKVTVWLPGCPQVDFDMYIDPPEGYAPATPERVHLRSDDSENPVLFGFSDSAHNP